MRSKGETLYTECCIQVDIPVPSKENRPKGFDMHRTPQMLNSTVRNMTSANNTRAVCSICTNTCRPSSTWGCTTLSFIAPQGHCSLGSQWADKHRAEGGEGKIHFRRRIWILFFHKLCWGGVRCSEEEKGVGMEEILMNGHLLWFYVVTLVAQWLLHLSLFPSSFWWCTHIIQSTLCPKHV